jgi:hypothetical protein
MIREQLETLGYKISQQQVNVDLSKFELVGNNYKVVITPWQEINNAQSELLSQFRAVKTEIDFQNIGKTYRTIMQKLSGLVFIPEKHIAKGIELGEAKYKNRLHTYIDPELKGSKLKEIRKYASSLIDSVEKAVDLSNNLTHDLDADRMIAESCLIGTISVIGIIKVIDKK